MKIFNILKKVFKLIDFHAFKNINWGYVYFINLFITLFLFIRMMKKVSAFEHQTEILLNKLGNYTNFPKEYIHFSIKDYNNIIIHIKRYFSVIILGVILSNLIHISLASFSPNIYVKISSSAYGFLFLSISTVFNAILYYSHQYINHKVFEYLLIMISTILALIGVCLFLFIRAYSSTSVLLIQASSSLVRKYPSLICFAFIQTILLYIMNILFSIIITLSFTPIWPIRHFVTLILYLAFSYYWIASTKYYICYMTIVGVISFEFQNSKKTNWASFLSFWRAITGQFTNAVFAGLALTVVQFNKHRAAKRKPRLHAYLKNRNKYLRFIVMIFEIPKFIMSYVLMFVFSIAECILTDVSSNALIYCMIDNCSYKQGTEKWLRENIAERVNKINQNTMISHILKCHRIIFTIIALFISSLSLYISNTNSQIWDFVITIIMTIVLMHSSFSILGTIIRTTSETLFLVYVEEPEKMNETFKNLYLELNKC